MDNLIDDKKKSFNFFQRFLLIVVIPIMFAVVVGLIIMVYSGADVVSKGKELMNQIPFLSAEKATSDQIIEDNKQNIADLENQLNEQQTNIETLESQLKVSEEESKALKVDKIKLQNQLDELKTTQEKTQKAFDDIVKTYETMSAKNSAAIISEMSENEGLKILASLKPAKLASILEKMEPSVASKYTELLAASDSSASSTENSSTETASNQ